MFGATGNKNSIGLGYFKQRREYHKNIYQAIKNVLLFLLVYVFVPMPSHKQYCTTKPSH